MRRSPPITTLDLVPGGDGRRRRPHERRNVFGGEGQADKNAGRDSGDTVADMANGPRAHNMQFPETVEFLVRLGSENSNNCRYATCVVPTLPSEKKQ